MRIIVLHNFIAPDCPYAGEVLQQATQISDILRDCGFKAFLEPVPDSLDDIPALIARHKADVIFNMVESFRGSDQHTCLIPAYLDTLGVPYTGCSTTAMFMTSDKCLAKRLLIAAGIPTPRSLDSKSTDDMLQADSPLQWIVKSATEHSSLGLDSNSLVKTKRQAQQLMLEKTQQYGGAWFAEQYIDGRELNVSIFGTNANPHILPVAEIHFHNFPPEMPRIFDYASKWSEDSFAYSATRRIFPSAKKDARLLERLRSISLSCWRLLHLHGYVRIDFRVDSKGNPYVLEINTNPYIMPESTFVAAAGRAGIPYEQVMKNLVQVACQRSGVAITYSIRKHLKTV